MTKYKKPKWAVKQMIRMSGLVEDICEHGVGHPNEEWIKAHPGEEHFICHGCDGCCDWTNEKTKKYKDRVKKMKIALFPLGESKTVLSKLCLDCIHCSFGVIGDDHQGYRCMKRMDDFYDPDKFVEECSEYSPKIRIKKVNAIAKIEVL